MGQHTQLRIVCGDPNSAPMLVVQVPSQKNHPSPSPDVRTFKETQKAFLVLGALTTGIKTVSGLDFSNSGTMNTSCFNFNGGFKLNKSYPRTEYSQSHLVTVAFLYYESPGELPLAGGPHSLCKAAFGDGVD